MTLLAPDPFSDLAPGPEGLAEGRRRYKRLARHVHPDVNDTDGDTMASLNLAWEAAQRRLGSARRAEVTITSRKHTYRVLRPVVAGDVADLHLASMASGHELVLKVARNPKDADLLAAEVASLKAIHADHPDGLNGWFPEVLDSFAFSAPGKPRRRATALTPLVGFYSLEEVLHAQPMAMDPRDTAWVARRILHALAQAHVVGRVHGGITLPHVMVHPTGHQVVLVGWGGSVEEGQPLRVLSRAYAPWYPMEARAKTPASTSTDLYMFGHVLGRMASEAPKEAWGPAKLLRSFAAGCSLEAESVRPDDAHELLSEFDDLLERIWGRRTYHEFTMPGPSRI